MNGGLVAPKDDSRPLLDFSDARAGIEGEFNQREFIELGAVQVISSLVQVSRDTHQLLAHSSRQQSSAHTRVPELTSPALKWIASPSRSSETTLPIGL